MKKIQKTDRILITGGAGFLGSHLVDLFKKNGYKNIRVPRSKDHDLTKLSHCRQVVKDTDVVIHLAAKVGGIGLNQKIPAEMFYDNLIMGVQLMHESWRNNVKKFVALGTICCYPKYTPVPFREDNLWDGYPEETNAPYGLAKKMLLIQSQAYRNQYGFNSIYLLPVNMYGPGDNFNESSSHVIPALIKKVYDAKIYKKNEITVWGTGKATREFLYVKDAARAIMFAMEKYNSPEPVNIGAGFEITIRELVKTITRLMKWSGTIRWDTSKPDGQPRRMLDTKRAKHEFGFVAKTSFEKGLTETIRWYEKKRKHTK